MAKKFYETDSFKKQQAEWYQKIANTLDDNGEKFVDIEKSETGEYIRPQVFDPDNEIKSTIEAERQEQDLRILSEYYFERDIDLIVFKLHTEGNSSRQIERHLANYSTKTLKQKAIVNLINKIRHDYLRTRS